MNTLHNISLYQVMIILTTWIQKAMEETIHTFNRC